MAGRRLNSGSLPGHELKPRITRNAGIENIEPGYFRLSIAGGSSGIYRLAQLDDYTRLNRAAFAWQAPCSLVIRGRVSAPDLPGTWGFGFWNDPFSANLGFSGMGRRLPALPIAAWFFYGSPPNFLSLGDTGPAQGFLASAFSSPRFPPVLLAPGLLGLPLLALLPAARLLRRLGRRLVKDEAKALSVDPTAWHTYRIDVRLDGAYFAVDGAESFATSLVQPGRLGRVIWIDNQYAAFGPDGRLNFGSLANPPAWLEVEIQG